MPLHFACVTNATGSSTVSAAADVPGGIAYRTTNRLIIHASRIRAVVRALLVGRLALPDQHSPRHQDQASLAYQICGQHLSYPSITRLRPPVLHRHRT